MAELAATPIVALDVASLADALAIVDLLGDRCGFYKIGSELFTAVGPEAVRAVRQRGKQIFLDLKFHDIPNTVGAAVRSAAALGASLVTVHASGGRMMLEAAAGAARAAPTGGLQRCRVLAVSILTSLDAAALAEAWGRPDPRVEYEVVRLARLAQQCGLDGLVCSALEARTVRREIGTEFELLIPGIRLAGSDSADQARVATPAGAVAAGATYIIVGRTVTGDPDPRAAMTRVLEQIGALG